MPAGDEVADIVDRVRRVPDVDKKFDADAAEAARTHRIDGTLLDKLLDLGLPCRGQSGERRFDSLDLENIGLELGLPSPRRRAMRYWSRTLLREDLDERAGYAVGVTGRCPAPGHSGDCRFALNPLVADAAVAGSVRSRRPGDFDFDVVMAHTERFFTGQFTALIQRLASFRFHILPRTLHFDTGFAMDTGLATCGLASRLALDFAAEMGLPVRAVHGYLVTAPYLTWHSWCEFESGGEWVAADPFMLTAMARWAVPGAERWPAHRATGALMWRIDVLDAQVRSPRFHPVTHAGDPAPFTIMSREGAR
jgi:hypothetical protein